MRYRALGRTCLNVSVIGFGASPLGNVFGDVSLKDSRAAVQHAISQGINFFDVSPYYGQTKAEERLGDALIGSRENIVLATKCGRYGASHFDFSSQTITRELENSLRRLRTDRVDLLQAHDIEFGDVNQIVTETIPAMRKLQEEGKVRFVGITSYWPGLLSRVAGKIPVDSVLNYCHSNLLMDDIHRELTPYVERSGIALLNASPLHMGLLAGKPPPEWHPAPAAVKRIALDVANTCRSYGEDSAAVALSFCLNDRAVSSTFIGMASAAQVNTNCLALDLSPPPDLMANLRQQIAPVLNTIWGSGLEKNWDIWPDPSYQSQESVSDQATSTSKDFKQ